MCGGRATQKGVPLGEADAVQGGLGGGHLEREQLRVGEVAHVLHHLAHQPVYVAWAPQMRLAPYSHVSLVCYWIGVGVTECVGVCAVSAWVNGV